MKHPLIKLFFIIVVAFAVNVVQVETASALIMLDGGGGTGGGGFLGTPTSFDIVLDRAETDPYSPGGTITITSNLAVQTCSNSSGNVTVTGVVRGSGLSPVVVFSIVGAQGGVKSTGTATLTAPSVAGSYFVDFDISGIVTGGALAGNSYHSVYSLPFTVAAAVVDPVVITPDPVVTSSCGTANGVSTSSSPDSYNLCTTTSFQMSADVFRICDNNDSSGDAGPCDSSDFTENPRWEWGCNTSSSNTGVTSYCSAPAPAPGVCGAAATIYASGATAYTGAYCNTTYGNSNIPAFPAAGSFAEWYCKDSDGTSTILCTATHEAVTAVPGVCGSVNGTTVSSLTSSSANLCSSATPTVTSGSFSGTGPWSWTCDGVNGGGKSPTCNASKTAAVYYTLSVLKLGTGSGTVTSSPTGIDCGATCSASYGSGTPVTLTAGAASGSFFDSWNGAGSGCGTATTCTVTMDTARAVTATFYVNLAVTLSPFNPSTITVGQTSTISFSIQNSVYYDNGICSESGTAPVNWDVSTPHLSGIDNASTQQMNTAGTYTKSVTCTNSGRSATSQTQTLTVVNPTAYTLSVLKSGTGSGTVTSNPVSAITGVPPTSASFVSGTSVTLTAGATSGTFTGWTTSPVSGLCPGTGTCTVTMDAAKAVTATFDVIPSMSGTLSVTPSPCIINVYESTCNVNLSWTVTNPEGKSSITSSNPSGLNYNGNADPASFNTTMPIVGEHNPVTFSLYNNSKLLTQTNVIVRCTSGTLWSGIVCVPVTYYTLSVLKSGSGTVISNPAGINCGATCSASYSSGTPVVLTATSGVGYTFTGWIVSDGTSCPGTGTCTVTTNAVKSVFATFTLISGVAPTLTFLASPATVAFGDSSTLQWVTTNAVSCTASGDWSGSKSVPNGSESQSNITVDKSYTLTCVNSVGTSVAKTVSVIVGCATDCSAAKASTICSGQSFSNGCSGICANKGTRVCGSSWKEVAP